VFNSTFQCIHSTLHKEGVRGLYRGLLSPLAGITPIYAVFFLGYSTGKKLQMKNKNDLLRCVWEGMEGVLVIFTTTNSLSIFRGKMHAISIINTTLRVLRVCLRRVEDNSV